ncbi:hypothetical protein ACWD48_19730 [Streptomyces sp. NPDC002519]
MTHTDPTAVLARIRQMADYWEQHLPEVIRTPAVVSALRAALEPAAASAVVSPPTDRAAVRAEAFRDAAGWASLNVHAAAAEGVRRWLLALADGELRRLAAEAQQPEWARPETEEEKLAKARRMAKALSAPPVTPPEWATTTEWLNRHKRPGDRRVHATAPFEQGMVRKFWTACEKPIGEGGYAMSHVPVDCRDCKRTLAAAGAQQQPETEAPVPSHWSEKLEDAFWTAVNAPTYAESTTATLAFAHELAEQIRRERDDADIPGSPATGDFIRGMSYAANLTDPEDQ